MRTILGPEQLFPGFHPFSLHPKPALQRRSRRPAGSLASLFHMEHYRSAISDVDARGFHPMNARPAQIPEPAIFLDGALA
jgi:hypothetical protein